MKKMYQCYQYLFLDLCSENQVLLWQRKSLLFPKCTKTLPKNI